MSVSWVILPGELISLFFAIFLSLFCRSYWCAWMGLLSANAICKEWQNFMHFMRSSSPLDLPPTLVIISIICPPSCILDSLADYAQPWNAKTKINLWECYYALFWNELSCEWEWVGGWRARSMKNSDLPIQPEEVTASSNECVASLHIPFPCIK